jgi:hypothetical protein
MVKCLIVGLARSPKIPRKTSTPATPSQEEFYRRWVLELYLNATEESSLNPCTTTTVRVSRSELKQLGIARKTSFDSAQPPRRDFENGLAWFEVS